MHPRPWMAWKRAAQNVGGALSAQQSYALDRMAGSWHTCVPMNVAVRAAKNFRGTVQGHWWHECVACHGRLARGAYPHSAFASAFGRGKRLARRRPPLAACMQPLPGRGVADTLSRPAGGRPACAGGRPHVQEARKAIWRTPHHADAESHCASRQLDACARSGRHREAGARRELQLATGHAHHTSLFASRAARSARLTPHAYGKGGQAGQW